VHGILPVTDSRSPVHRVNIPATCGNCHADPDYMRDYPIPTDQLAKYSRSVHGVLLLDQGDAAAPACNDCHGNHGASPPGLTSIANACGECHALNRDLFNKSPHKPAYAEMELGECTTCHDYHEVAKTSDKMLGVGDESMCINCHEDGDPGYQAAKLMRAQLDSLAAIIDSSAQLLERAEQGGVDVKGGRFDLQQAKSALIKARGAVHAFDPEPFAAIVHPGIAEARIVKEVGEAALHGLQMRRVGLAFSIPLILLVAFGLYWKIRRLESSSPQND
jgi:predicted CXXCH cytochrome family protein